MLTRRHYLYSATSAALALLEGCRTTHDAHSKPDAVGELGARTLLWHFPGGISTAVAIVIPNWSPPPGGFPVLVAFHGRGEALKDPDEGAMGWPADYGLVRALGRLRHPPLTMEDFQGFVTATDLSVFNSRLAMNPYRGVVTICPHLSEAATRGADAGARFGAFLEMEVLSKVWKECPVKKGREATSVDGVSMGGRFALSVGLARPDLFSSISAIQPALDESEGLAMTDKIRGVLARYKDVRFRLMTSEGDGFRDAVTRTSRAWRASGVVHDLRISPGPHDYAFNRGPGVFETLLWHEATSGR